MLADNPAVKLRRVKSFKASPSRHISFLSLLALQMSTPVSSR
jgi:hypothetical protein